MRNKTLILIPVLAVALAVSGCGKKETPKPVVSNTNAQQVNENTNTNVSTNQNSDVNENQGAVENGQSGEQGEEIEVSDKVVSNIEIIDTKDTSLIFDPWNKDSKSFLFKKYNTKECEFFCNYSLYKYSVEKNDMEIIQSKEESLLKKDWIVSNNGKFAVKVVSGYSENPSEDLGTIYIKNLETNEIKTLGKKIYRGGDQDKYTFSYYNNPAWSPNDKWVAFYDYNNGEVAVMSSDANGISEIKILGKTFFMATARNDEYYVYWSPDSTKLFAKDGYPIFSVDPIAELYPSNDDGKYVKDWRWSPDSKKILGIVYISGSLDFYIMNYDGSNKKTIISIKDTSNKYPSGLSADWSPNSKDIVYAYNQSMYILDTETMTKTEIAEKNKNYTNPHWSPDGKRIIYELNDQIGMITLK